MRSPALTILLTVLVFLAAFAFYTVGRASGAADTQDQATTSASERAMRLHDRTLAWRQKLQTAQQQQERRLATARVAATAAWQQAQVVDSEIASGADSLRATEAATWRSAAQAERLRGEACQLTLNICAIRVTHAEEDAQRLRDQLGRQTALQQCAWHLAVLKFGCPSRSAMFFGGAVIGVGVTILVRAVGR